MVIGTIERTSKFVRNKFSALFSNFSTNCSKKTKSIYIVPRTYNMLHGYPSLPFSPSLSHPLFLALVHWRFQLHFIWAQLVHRCELFPQEVFCISVFQSFCLFFLGNEKTINHCANEVRVWATLTSIFLMPFFDSVSFFFLL